MSGSVILGVGIALIVLAAILFVMSIVYRKTAGRKIRDELRDEYE